jgi:hypothetical protein
MLHMQRLAVSIFDALASCCCASNALIDRTSFPTSRPGFNQTSGLSVNRPQFAEGGSMWSITSTGTGPLPDSSLRPSWS